MDLLTIENGYDSGNDFSSYGSSVKYHERLVKKGGVARDLPRNAHITGVQCAKSGYVIKTVPQV